MMDSGIFSIQSHTANHTMMAHSNNYDEELRGSKEKLKLLLVKRSSLSPIQ